MDDMLKRLATMALREMEKRAEQVMRDHGFASKDWRSFGEYVGARADGGDTRNPDQMRAVRDRMMAEANPDERPQSDLPPRERGAWMQIVGRRNRFRRNVRDAAEQEVQRFRTNMERNLAGLEKRLKEDTLRVGNARLTGVDWWDDAVFDENAKRAAVGRGRDELARRTEALTRRFPETAHFKRNVVEGLMVLRSIHASTLDHVLAEVEPEQARLSNRAPFDPDHERAGMELAFNQAETAIRSHVERYDTAARAAIEAFDATMRDALTAWAAGADPSSLPSSWRIERPIGFETLRAEFGRPALLLHRPYPPRTPSGRSRIGGRPNLPDQLDWPRTRDGAALHFLAQIDLAEMPQVETTMPGSGTLLFFAHMAGELDIGPHDREQVRVLYDPTSGPTLRTLPTDLGRLDSPRRPFLDAAGSDPRTYPVWPLLGTRIESIPTLSAFGQAAFEPAYAEYAREWRRFRLNQTIAAIGTAPSSSTFIDPAQIMEIVRGSATSRIKSFEESGFPWVKLGKRLVATALEPLPGLDDGLKAELALLTAPGELCPPEDVVDAEGAAKLIGFVNRLLDDRRVDARRITNAVIGVAETLVMCAGGDPRLAAALPDDLYALVAPRHRQGDTHQMFGYVPSTQEPLRADAHARTLLQLRSDYGVDLLIGDVGELDFRIMPEALSRHRWDQVDGIYNGG